MAAGRVERVNGFLEAINPVSARLVAERTGYSSQLVPVTPYVAVSVVEAFHRYPDAVEAITAAMSPEEIGEAARRPGCQVNSVFLWGIANFWLLGRNVMNMVDPSLDSVDRAHTVLDFWARVSYAYRGGGYLHAAEAGNRIEVLDRPTIEALAEGARPLDNGRLELVRRFNATLINHLFLLYFDTRVGHGDTGPYRLPDGRIMLVRDYHRLGPSDFWWSGVASDMPYSGLTAALVLDPEVEVAVNDFGTAITRPEDYLEHLTGFGLFTTDSGSLVPVPDEECPALTGVARLAQRQHYRDVVAMSRDDKIACGAYVYFTFLRPFAEIAGVADTIDWTCPRDTSEDLYGLVTADADPPERNPDDVPYPLYT